MWLHLPATCLPSCPSAQATADSTWDSTSRLAALARSAGLNGTPTPPRSWSRAWKSKPWLTRLCGQMPAPSTADRGAASWIASLAATRASRSASPASAPGPTIPGISGPTSPASWPRSAPGSASSRTSATTSTSGWPRSPLTSQEWATRLNAAYSARRKWAHRTAANASSSWPTPNVPNGGRMAREITATGQTPRGKRQVDLRQYVADFWPTPHQNCTTGAGTQGRGGGLKVQTAVATWPTPSARDFRSGEASDEIFHGNARPLNEVACRFSRPDLENPSGGAVSSVSAPTSRPRLNPLFVGWLMGLPEGWLDAQSSLGPAVMASYRSRLRMHFTSSRDRWDSDWTD